MIHLPKSKLVRRFSEYGSLIEEYKLVDKKITLDDGIKKYDQTEETVFEKLKTVMSEKDIQRNIDTLIATQIVRRIGPEILQNNESHTELPDLPENLKSII